MEKNLLKSEIAGSEKKSEIEISAALRYFAVNLGSIEGAKGPYEVRTLKSTQIPSRNVKIRPTFLSSTGIVLEEINYRNFRLSGH